MTTTSDPSRRDVLRWLAGTAAVGVAGGSLIGCSSDDRTAKAPASTTSTEPIRRSTVPPERRRLVVIELGGGNDGLSTLVPMDSGIYRDARPTIAIEPTELIDVDGEYGVPRMFRRLHEQGLTFLAGVGTAKPNLSHFDMLSRWWTGTPNVTPPNGPGFLGRMCDVLGDRERIAGVSIGLRTTPAMAAEHPTTMGLPESKLLTGFGSSSAAANTAYLDAIADLGAGGAAAPDPLLVRGGQGLGLMLEADELLAKIPAPGDAYAKVDDLGKPFAQQLAFASQLIRADLGVRVLHLASDAAAFDTHGGHNEAQARAWGALLPGIEAFRDELEAAGLTDEVMIVTTSEFGRRVKENSQGLDHGAASCALVMGPTKPGVVGEHPPLDALDDAGNLRATVMFDRYLATMAAWLDVDPSSHYGHYALAQSLKRLGRIAEARTHLRLALAMAPSSALYRSALARLPADGPGPGA